MIEERRIRRMELRAPSASEEIQALYGDMESALIELHNQIREVQDGRLRIPTAPVSNPSDGSWYLSENSSGSRYINVYNESTSSYESAALT